MDQFNGKIKLYKYIDPIDYHKSKLQKEIF